MSLPGKSHEEELLSGITYLESLTFRRTATICEISTPEIFQLVVHPLYRQLLLTTIGFKKALADNSRLREDYARLLRERHGS